MNNKILYGVVSASDQNGIKADQLLGMSFVSGTALILHNEGMDAASGGNITLTVTDTKMKDVCKAIVNEINHGTQAFVVLGDELTSEYLHPNITVVASTTAS
jgi:hypothetical protein